jgi:hypothetical protein
VFRAMWVFLPPVLLACVGLMHLGPVASEEIKTMQSLIDSKKGGKVPVRLMWVFLVLVCVGLWPCRPVAAAEAWEEVKTMQSLIDSMEQFEPLRRMQQEEASRKALAECLKVL